MSEVINEEKRMANGAAKLILQETMVANLEERLTEYIYETVKAIKGEEQRIADLELALTLAAEAVRTGQYYKVAGIARKALEGSDE